MMNNTPVVIVTGASRGLGAAVACWLGKAGAAVTLIARSEEKLNKTGDEVRRLGGVPLIFRADVSRYDACRKTVDKTLDRFGRIDAVVNNAGIVQPIPRHRPDRSCRLAIQPRSEFDRSVQPDQSRRSRFKPAEGTDCQCK